MEQKKLETKSGNIIYWIYKKDTALPWLVFLPGLSADHMLFEKQIEYFSEKYNCLVWDAPAHGLSRPFELNFTMRDIADYLHMIFQFEGITYPILIGQSLGGYISQVYMDQYPGSASGFVSIDSCSLSRKYYTWWEIALLKRTKWMYMSIPWKLLLKWGISGTSVSDYGRKVMEEAWSVYNKKEYCELADHGSRIFAEAVEEKSEYPIRCPVLLLCGEKDMSGSAKSYNRRWTKQDGFKLVWIKGAGHNSNTDAPDIVNLEIDRFIQSIDKSNV